MSASAFTLILLLRTGESRARVLAMVSPARRAAVESELESLARLSPGQIRDRLDALRREQVEGQRERARERARARVNRPLDHASPRLVSWLGRLF